MATRPYPLSRQIRQKLRDMGHEQYAVRVISATHHKKAGRRWLTVEAYTQSEHHTRLTADYDIQWEWYGTGSRVFYEVPRNIPDAAATLLLVMP
jgi:hypothetical protein